MMTSKKRVLAAVDHKNTDRVPITFDAEKEVYDSLLRHLNVGSKEALFDRLHVDTWMVLPKNFIYPDTETGKEVKTSIWGYKTRMTRYSCGVYDQLCFSPLAGKDSTDDIRNHPWPAEDVLDFSGFPTEIRSHQDRAIIGVFTWGAFFIATHVRAIEDLMIDFAERKSYAQCLLRSISDRSIAYLNHMLELFGEGIDIVYMADDYCSQRGPLFSPAAFQEFIMPYLTEIAEIVHRHDKKFLLHVCGAVRPLLPMIIDAGVDLLEPIQIRAVGMEPEGLKCDFGQDITFYGGMDLQHVLCREPPARVADETKRLIDILGKDGGYIFGPGHTYIQADAPIHNILSMYDTAHHYYPWAIQE